jgi:tetratricopeptide (TPR) repeat protein
MIADLFRRLTAVRGSKDLPASMPSTAAPEAVDASRLIGEGVSYFEDGDLAAAEIAFRNAIERKHDLAEAHFYLGRIHRRRGELEDAADHMVLATAFKPDFADAWFHLGAIDLERGNFVDARKSLDAALRLNPRHVGAHTTYAGVREQQKRFAAAIEHWKAVVEADPGNAHAWCKLSRLTLRETQDDALAMNFARRALELQPGLAEVHSCIAQLLQFQGLCNEAVEECDIALRIEPDAHDAQMVRAFALLSLGKFDEGWQDYEMRKRIYPIYAVRKHPYPEWDGTSLAGKRLLIYCEQGIGDEIMFASCVPDILGAGAKCVLECSRRLAPVFSRSFPAATVVVADQTSTDLAYLDELPQCDFQVAAGSLPRFLRGGREDFPTRSGYLSPEPEAQLRWRTRLDGLGCGLKIGVSWRGGVRQTSQVARSIDLALLLPIFELAGCHCVSLQYGEQEKEITGLRSSHGARLEYWPQALQSFDETAALASAVDLVVSVDTTVAHLAAAMGVPTWVMLPANAEWRYMVAGETMPWYPAMRIFRRQRNADWVRVIEAVCSGIQALAGTRRLSS